jgi:maltose O-acetyltransferase
MKNNLRYFWPMHFVLLLTNWLPDNVIFIRLRGFLASFFFKKCGKNLRIGRNITFYRPYDMELGNNIYIASGCWFNAKIEIEDDVLFGPQCVISGSNHSLKNGSYRYGNVEEKGKVIIGYGSWISAMCTIVAGGKVGKSCLLASNSVLNKQMEDKSIYGGSPAKFIKYHEEEI